MNIFNTLPSGDSAQWDDAAFTDAQGKKYDSSAYALKYEIRGPVALTLTAVANGSGWRTTLATTDSATLTPGTYYWAAYVSKTGERFTAAQGELTITANIAVAAAGYDGRTLAAKALADAEAALATFKSTQGKIKKYMINSRMMEFEAAADILPIISYWRTRVANEKHAQDLANGLGNPRALYVRFSK